MSVAHAEDVAAVAVVVVVGCGGSGGMLADAKQSIEIPIVPVFCRAAA